MLDNARSHKTGDVSLYGNLANRYGIHFVFLPGYAPHLSPIETIFGLVKRKLAKTKPRGANHMEYIIMLMDDAHNLVDIPSLFAKTGYN